VRQAPGLLGALCAYLCVLCVEKGTFNTEIAEVRTQRTQRKSLSALENGFTLFEECRHPFLLVFGREDDGEQVDLAAEAFVEVRA